MATSIYLTLDGTTLKWSPNGSTNWTPVGPDSPKTGVNENDEVDWIADDTISKVKIKPNKSAIIKQVNGDDTKTPKGVTNSSIPNPTTEKYTISVKPADPAGGYLDFDPELRYPPG
ncbi:hypothetical protein [Marinoscillum sp. MHG1-6]|uniref:hypothetical protein n=1 Tax=Marinoscillum sp. MHG1-6 TaxID=2959627 RepID=UPI00215797DC|nr:hypothetical protein [Marinoscillum sp. MHG1-6]